LKRIIAIIGGGLAGLAAAVRLIEADCIPIVIESRKRLGGRAASFVDPRSGITIDNCQHVLLGCCTHLLDLYRRVGVLDQIEWHRELHWTSPALAAEGRVDVLSAGWLPAPFHLAPSLMRFALWSAAERRDIARAAQRMLRLGARGRAGWRDRTFGEFLRACGQGETTIRRFWNTIIVSACNLEVDRVSAAYAMQVVQQGFLASRGSYTMGVPNVPLGELYDPAAAFIRRGGGDVFLGLSARSIAFDGDRVSGVVTEGPLVEASAVIAAVPPDRLAKLVSGAMVRADRRLAALDEFTFSPILGVHLFFETPIMETPHLVLVDAPEGVQWLFNKGLRPDGAKHVHAVISAADAWMDLDEGMIVDRVLRDVHAALPASRGLAPVEARAIKEKRATFAAVPGVDSLRPGAAAGFIGLGGGGIRNLFLAGDWCETGWPATMESAVRSGYAAAAAVTGLPLAAGEPPTGALARLMGLR
jgi:zeta-carotene desaturase